MLHVLAGPAKLYLDQPERLKYLLAPVICRNAAEQERFYEVFDRYYGEVQGAGSREQGAEPSKKTFTLHRSPFTWLIGILLLGLLAYWVVGLLRPEGPTHLYFGHEESVILGDTFRAGNSSENLDTSEYDLKWVLLGMDSTRNQFVIAVDSSNRYNFEAVIDTVGEVPVIDILLIGKNRETGDTMSISSWVRVECANPPEIQEIVAPTEADPGKEIRFSIAGTPDNTLRYRWLIGPSDTLQGPRVTYTFQNQGPQTVTLIIDRPGTMGYCQVESSHSIQIGRQRVSLDILPLLKAPPEPHLEFAIGTWLLLGLLGLGALIFWLKWFGRKSLPSDESPVTSHQSPRFAALDLGPYFIPFRNRSALIHPSKEPMRLADVLRRRQEGLRLEVDVPASVNATIRKGGFPVLKERYNSQPTDYLFLVDEQSPNSHQARLFHYLVGMLRQRDVHLEVFFFKSEPSRVWNADFPQGMALEQLHRILPVHRLVVLGEGYGMLDPHSVGKHEVRGGLSAALRGWRQRMLLTPAPPRAWGFQEAALQQLFVLFPADLQGMAQAAGYFESDLDSSDLPLTFNGWKEQLEAPRQDPDPQFRRWRAAGEHRDYLKDYPELFRWLCAIAVYPKPNWDLTLAIGEAMGIHFTYDDLLLLSRIPWLQSGDLHPRLREELLEYASEEDEKLARAAVRQELSAVAEATSRGAANQELQVHLAIQDFALEPENPEFRDTIRQLLAQGLLSRKQESELDQVVQRNSAPIAQQSNISQFIQQKQPGIREFLKDQSPVTSHQSQKIWTPAFKYALACSLLFLVLFLSIWAMVQQNTLEKILPLQGEPSHYFLVKESVYIDSSVIYNNEGVDTFYANHAEDMLLLGFLPFQARYGENAANLFKKAAGMARADSNLLKLYYNLGVQNYKEFENAPNDTTLRESLGKSQAWFQQALQLPDAHHGLGIVHYFLGDTAAARKNYQDLVGQTDSLFFDTTSIFPNLETLLFPNLPPEIREVKISEARGGGLEVFVTYFPNERLYPQLSMEALPLLDNGKAPRGLTPAVKVLKKGETEALLPVTSHQSPVTTTTVRLRLRSTGGYVVDEKTVPYVYNWQKKVESSSKKGPEPRVDTIPLEQKPPIDSKTEQILDPNPQESKDLLSQKSNNPGQQKPVYEPIIPAMVRVEGGTFRMGCDPRDKKMQKIGCPDNSEPAHEVTLSSFSIGKYEVTNEEFAVFLNDRGNQVEGGSEWYNVGCGIDLVDGVFLTTSKNHPVSCVTWYAANAYAKWLNEKIPGAKYRLPTEAEWEYAARGGKRGWKDNYLYSGSDNLDEVGWYDGVSALETKPVGGKKANQLGIHDMSGNVSEFCADWYGPFDAKPQRNPKGPASGTTKVGRGNSWLTTEGLINRSTKDPKDSSGSTGFRLCQD
ncbi:MAG: SUMF1/EgtB/PvdO family nonheme iron enzyme [Saprospirales bacterium]|nr:SUMF1/EgtB/PvdO family nonheme iron enzyme [Saprospirales bacterium]